MRKIIAFVALVATAACNLDTGTTAPYAGSLTGTYTLQTMNGAPLPFTLVSADTTSIIDSDVIVMADDGSWSEKVAFRQTIGTAAATYDTLALAGSWTRTSPLSFYRAPNGTLTYQGTASETSLALTDGYFNYLFQR